MCIFIAGPLESILMLRVDSDLPQQDGTRGRLATLACPTAHLAWSRTIFELMQFPSMPRRNEERVA